MIQSFFDKKTENFYSGQFVKAFSGFDKVAQRRLDQFDAATSLGDLALPAFNLEKLKGDRAGQWSIRVNMQMADMLYMAR